MKLAAVLLCFLLCGCESLNSIGIGGKPELVCRGGLAAIDDRIAGSDDMHASMVRRFKDGDALCAAK